MGRILWPLPTTFLLLSPFHPSLLKAGIRFVFKPLKRGNLLPNLPILRIKQEHASIEMCNREWFTKTAIPEKYIQPFSIFLKQNYIKCWFLRMSTGNIIKILISHCGCLGDQKTTTCILKKEAKLLGRAPSSARPPCAPKFPFHDQENINHPCPDLKAIDYPNFDCFPSF